MGFFMGVDVGSPQFVASVIVAGFTLLVPLLLRGGLLFRTGLDYLLEVSNALDGRPPCRLARV